MDIRKRKRTSKILQKVFVKEKRVVDVMQQNLIPPQGVEGSRGRVIREPELDIFYYNGNFDLVFQREEEFHLASTAQLIRIKDGIQRGTPEAEEMFKKMEMAIEARDDVIQARKIVQDNLDGLGMRVRGGNTLTILLSFEEEQAKLKLFSKVYAGNSNNLSWRDKRKLILTKLRSFRAEFIKVGSLKALMFEDKGISLSSSRLTRIEQNLKIHIGLFNRNHFPFLVALSTEKGNGHAGWNSECVKDEPTWSILYTVKEVWLDLTEGGCSLHSDAFSSSFLDLSSEVVAARWGYGSMNWKCSYLYLRPINHTHGTMVMRGVVIKKMFTSDAGWFEGSCNSCSFPTSPLDLKLAMSPRRVHNSSCDEVVSGRGIGREEEYTPVTRHHKPKNNNSYTRKQLVYDNCGDMKLRSLFDISPTPAIVYDDIKATGEKKTFCSIECRSMQIAQMEEESIKKKTMMRNKHDCGSSTSYSPQQVPVSCSSGHGHGQMMSTGIFAI
ncbi:hypothetical protein Tco_0966837 [Tanacetum coccineum]